MLALGAGLAIHMQGSHDAAVETATNRSLRSAAQQAETGDVGMAIAESSGDRLARDCVVPTPRLPKVDGVDRARPVDPGRSRAIMGTAKETPGYLKIGDGALYFVHHKAQGEARGTVILCGPIALEASRVALVWTRWARTLVSAGWNAVRFDWRGSGESAGRFSSMTLRDWESDLHGLYDAIATTSTNVRPAALRPVPYRAGSVRFRTERAGGHLRAPGPESWHPSAR